jgi:hypothetical protein
MRLVFSEIFLEAPLLYRQFFKVIETWRVNGVFDLGKLAPLFVVEFTTPRFWPQFAPPIEKERDVVSEALIANFAHPIGFHRASPRFAFLPKRSQSTLIIKF